MNDWRLYIDGTLMDMPENPGITLEFVSNFLTDPDKIASDKSYTIKLPRTISNMAAIGHAEDVGGEDDWAREIHSADLQKNGVQLLSGAQCTLLSIGTEIEVCLAWGLYPKLKTMSDDGLALNEIADDCTDALTFTGTTDPDTTAGDYYYADIDFALHDTTDFATKTELTLTSTGRKLQSNYDGFYNTGKYYLHPVVSVPYILDKIRQKYSLTLTWHDDAQTLIDALIVPLLTRTWDSDVYGSDNADVFTANTLTSRGDYTLTAGTQNVGLFNVAAGNSFKEFKAAQEASITFEVGLRFTIALTSKQITALQENGRCDVWLPTLVAWKKNDDGVERINFGESTRLTADLFDTLPTAGEAIILTGRAYVNRDVEAGDRLKFMFRPYVDSAWVFGGNVAGVEITYINAYPSEDGEVPIGGLFPIIPNLPEISCLDFIKALAFLTGSFAKQQSDDGVIEFVPYNVFSRSNALDWSAKLLPASDENTPASLSFVVSDWAQKNWYKYADDDTVQGNYDGSINIDDATLEAERTAYELPFAASDGASVPLYESQYDEDKKEYNLVLQTCDPRILLAYEKAWEDADGNEKSVCGATFDGLDVPSILAQDAYSTLIDAMRGAYVLEETFVLSELDVVEFDETKPVYLAQFGAYFAVLSIKTKDNGTATVQMIKINI